MKVLRNNKGFSAVEALLILVIIGILSFVGWFVWQSKRSADNSLDAAKNSSPAAISQTDEKVTEQADNYQGWKSFQNDTVGVSFRYPEDWAVDQSIKCLVNPSSATGQECFANLTWTPFKEKYAPTIEVERLTYDLTRVEGYYNDYYAQSAENNVTKEKTQIDGKSAIKYTVLNSGTTTKQVLIQSGDRVFNFESVNPKNVEGLDYYSVFDKVFKSFKITY